MRYLHIHRCRASRFGWDCVWQGHPKSPTPPGLPPCPRAGQRQARSRPAERTPGRPVRLHGRVCSWVLGSLRTKVCVPLAPRWDAKGTGTAVLPPSLPPRFCSKTVGRGGEAPRRPSPVSGRKHEYSRALRGPGGSGWTWLYFCLAGATCHVPGPPSPRCPFLKRRSPPGPQRGVSCVRPGIPRCCAGISRCPAEGPHAGDAQAL